MKYSVHIFFFISIVAVSCKDTYNKDNFSTKKEETKGVDPVKVEYIAIHVNDELTKILFRFSSKDLIYSKTGSENFTCDVKINYRIFHSNDEKILIDSGTVKISDINNDNTIKDLSGEIPVKLLHGGKYKVKLRLTDNKKDITTEDELSIDKALPRSRQNFFIA